MSFPEHIDWKKRRIDCPRGPLSYVPLSSHLPLTIEVCSNAEQHVTSDHEPFVRLDYLLVTRSTQSQNSGTHQSTFYPSNTLHSSTNATAVHQRTATMIPSNYLDSYQRSKHNTTIFLTYVASFAASYGWKRHEPEMPTAASKTSRLKGRSGRRPTRMPIKRPTRAKQVRYGKITSLLKKINSLMSSYQLQA